MMHLTCTNMPVHKIDHALHTIKSNGIQNVLALHGDLPHGQDKFVQVQGGFACALDLVGYYFPLLQISVCVCLFLNNNLAWLALAWLPSQQPLSPPFSFSSFLLPLADHRPSHPLPTTTSSPSPLAHPLLLPSAVSSASGARLPVAPCLTFPPREPDDHHHSLARSPSSRRLRLCRHHASPHLLAVAGAVPSRPVPSRHRSVPL
ncbi:hypothetical protein Tsubulata_020697 [Turnera subulata]|uniref:Methylenetetrahydrofolate reductase n=1 Tax=Turnera subulata TaxID=218843 RepID=A0A9Q0JD95_9ROSI|nr:hypothetical protein Tsubulata_020697 [Turnera subulata]